MMEVKGAENGKVRKATAAGDIFDNNKRYCT